jgi:tRNA 2-selenouridine synthase
MRSTTTLFLDIPFAERVQHLCDLYGDYPVEELRASIERIEKRLGGVATRTALAALDEGDIATTAASTLAYYDKTYLRGLQRRDVAQVQRLAFENASVEMIADALLLYSQNS